MKIILLLILIAMLVTGIIKSANWQGYEWVWIIFCIVLGFPILYLAQDIMDRKK